MNLPDWLKDVQIQTTAVPEDLGACSARGVLWQAAPGRFLLHVPEVARYLVENGRQVTVDPGPDADMAQVQRFMHMTPLAALLYQRGLLAFHAAAAVPPDGEESGAILIAGDSAAGKSTLLVALQQRGWQILADDLAAVDENELGRPVVRPTFQEVMLWEDAAEKLKLPPLDYGQSVIIHEGGRRVYALPDRIAEGRTGGQPLKCIVRLAVHTGDEIEMERVAGAKAFRSIGTLIYNSHIADALLERTVYMLRAASIAQSIPIYRLRRPRGQWSVEELLRKVEDLTGGTG
jgi:hypothetical protein